MPRDPLAWLPLSSIETGFDYGQTGEIGIGRDFARSRKELAPAERVGAGVAIGFLSWIGPHELQPSVYLVGAGCGRCLRGGIGIEQQGILDSRSASRLFSISSSFVCFLLSSSRCSCCLVCCWMSYTGRQLNVASKRRQRGKVETYSDLLSRSSW